MNATAFFVVMQYWRRSSPVAPPTVHMEKVLGGPFWTEEEAYSSKEYERANDWPRENISIHVKEGQLTIAWV